MLSICVILFCVTTAVSASSFGHVSQFGSEKIFYDISESSIIFNEFLQTFNKKYDEKEYKHRLGIFTKNLEKINKLNNSNGTAIFGITKFSDMTEMEFEKYLGKIDYGSFNKTKQTIFVDKAIKAPDSLDWREQGAVTHVKDQGHCGSCYIFGALANLESQNFIKSNQLIALSEQQVLDCGSQGCGGGSPLDVFEYIKNAGGIQAESDYTYTGQKGQCNFQPDYAKVKVSDYGTLSINDEDELKDYLNKYGVITVIIDRISNSNFQHYKGGIFQETCNGTGGHCIAVVGYGTENNVPYWIIKNSWGPSWGESGYARMLRGSNLCGIVNNMAYSIV